MRDAVCDSALGNLCIRDDEAKRKSPKRGYQRSGKTFKAKRDTSVSAQRRYLGMYEVEDSQYSKNSHPRSPRGEGAISNPIRAIKEMNWWLVYQSIFGAIFLKEQQPQGSTSTRKLDVSGIGKQVSNSMLT